MATANKNKIGGIFLSEFHPTAGPMIKYQVPYEKITKEYFDAIHQYIITKPELQGRLITVNAFGHKILGCPVCIDDPKYTRNAYMFNLCFFFEQSTETCFYEPVVKKLAYYLTQAELQSKILSGQNSQQVIPPFLETVLHMLNKHGSCSVPLGESGTVHLKVAPAIVEPPPVQDHDVPILVKDKALLSQGRHWDLTTQQVLPYIDGFNHVTRIAAEADVEINLVKSCLQNLLYYDIIKMISIFMYSNMYTVAPKIKNLYMDPQLQEQCIQFVAKKGRSLPRLRDIFILYSSLTHGVTVKDLCCRYCPYAMKIDERKLIQFGLLKDLIRRLHKYPVKLADNSSANSKLDALYHWCDGTHCYDEISCKTGISQMELDEVLEAEPTFMC